MTKLMDRLAGHDEPFPWQVADEEHQRKVEGLLVARQTAERAVDEARQAAGHSRRVLEAYLKDAGGDDFEPEAFATELVKLRAIYDSWVARIDALAPVAEYARRRHTGEQGNNPASVVRAQHIANLKAIMMGNDVPEQEKVKAWKELQRIEDAERPRVINSAPPGFDASKYDSHGNLRR